MFLRIFMFGEYFYMYQSTCLSRTYFFHFKKVNGQGQKLMPVNSQFFFFAGHAIVTHKNIHFVMILSNFCMVFLVVNWFGDS